MGKSTYLEEKLKQLGLSRDGGSSTAAKKLSFQLFFPQKPYDGAVYRAAIHKTGHYNFVGLLLGPGGTTVQRVQRTSGARVEVHSSAGNLNGAKPAADDPSLHALILADSQARLEHGVRMVVDALQPTNGLRFQRVRVVAGGSAHLALTQGAGPGSSPLPAASPSSAEGALGSLEEDGVDEEEAEEEEEDAEEPNPEWPSLRSARGARTPPGRVRRHKQQQDQQQGQSQQQAGEVPGEEEPETPSPMQSQRPRSSLEREQGREEEEGEEEVNARGMQERGMRERAGSPQQQEAVAVQPPQQEQQQEAVLGPQQLSLQQQQQAVLGPQQLSPQQQQQPQGPQGLDPATPPPGRTWPGEAAPGEGGEGEEASLHLLGAGTSTSPTRAGAEATPATAHTQPSPSSPPMDYGWSVWSVGLCTDVLHRTQQQQQQHSHSHQQQQQQGSGLELFQLSAPALPPQAPAGVSAICATAAAASPFGWAAPATQQQQQLQESGSNDSGGSCFSSEPASHLGALGNGLGNGLGNRLGNGVLAGSPLTLFSSSAGGGLPSPAPAPAAPGGSIMHPYTSPPTSRAYSPVSMASAMTASRPGSSGGGDLETSPPQRQPAVTAAMSMSATTGVGGASWTYPGEAQQSAAMAVSAAAGVGASWPYPGEAQQSWQLEQTWPSAAGEQGHHPQPTSQGRSDNHHLQPPSQGRSDNHGGQGQRGDNSSGQGGQCYPPTLSPFTGGAGGGVLHPQQQQQQPKVYAAPSPFVAADSGWGGSSAPGSTPGSGIRGQPLAASPAAALYGGGAAAAARHHAAPPHYPPPHHSHQSSHLASHHALQQQRHHLQQQQQQHLYTSVPATGARQGWGGGYAPDGRGQLAPPPPPPPPLPLGFLP